jgi:Tfp pilus assembly protein PilV
LIEVMLAVALMAVTALGLIAAQLWMAREAQASAMRERAAWIADSMVETLRVPVLADSAIQALRARASSALPHGEASVSDSGGVSTARITWTALRDTPRTGDVIDKPESCGSAEVPAGTACVVMAFMK